jgi:hypothetical protein
MRHAAFFRDARPSPGESTAVRRHIGIREGMREAILGQCLGDGRGWAAPVAGRVFSNPGAGAIGGLQVLKTFAFVERSTLDLRGDFFLLTSTPDFSIGGQSINSNAFGRITSTASCLRVVQFGLYLRL